MASLQEKYELIEPLGQGGMASVWRAKVRGPAGFERACVIKRILHGADADREAVAMFVREARLSALLNHRNIVQVFDFGQADGEYFIAMEYVEGRDALAMLRALRGAMAPVGAALLTVRELCRALAYAHSLTDESGKPLGLVHRDVSPANVLLASDGSVKLVDFGVAKAVSLGTSVTRAGTIKGKLSYMAPEQLRGGTVDGRADIFAAGIILHELLCGRRLFRADDDDATVAAVLSLEIPVPSSLRSDVPAAVDHICLRALARDPEQRWASAGDMADALDPLVHELGWDAGRMAAWLRVLSGEGAQASAAPPGPSDPTQESLLPPHGEETRRTGTPLEVTTTGTAAPITQRHRRRPLAIATTGMVALVAVAAVAWKIIGGEPSGAVQIEQLASEQAAADPAAAVPAPSSPSPADTPPPSPSPPPVPAASPPPLPLTTPPRPAGKAARAAAKREASLRRGKPRAGAGAPSAPATAPPRVPSSDVMGGVVVDPFSR